MAGQSKEVPSDKSCKQKVWWLSEAEKKLIEVWSEILTTFGGQMVTKKPKGSRATEAVCADRAERSGLSFSHPMP